MFAVDDEIINPAVLLDDDKGIWSACEDAVELLMGAKSRGTRMMKSKALSGRNCDTTNALTSGSI